MVSRTNTGLGARLLIWILAAAVITGGLSCRSDSARAVFEMRYIFEVNVPAGLNTFNFHQLVLQNKETGIDFFLEQNNLEFEDISAINTSFARLTTLLGDEDLSMIDEIVIDLFKPDNRDLNFEAAYTLQIPIRGIDRVQLIPSITNLKEVLGGQQFDVVMHMRFRSIPPRNFTAVLEMGFEAFREGS